MDPVGLGTMVTGGASGLGRATARALIGAGATVTLVDLPSSGGQAVAEDLGDRCRFAAADVTDPEAVRAAISMATDEVPLRALVHCGGRGGSVRVLDREGRAGPLDAYEAIVRTNLIGSFNMLRLAAEAMAAQPMRGEERGVVILTASIAAFEGQIGQIAYASSKAGVVGMTLVAARDLARRGIRVCSIAPGVFDTAMLARLPEPTRQALGQSVPHPSRLGSPEEFAELAVHLVRNPMINGETIRLDGALRMGPR